MKSHINLSLLFLPFIFYSSIIISSCNVDITEELKLAAPTCTFPSTDCVVIAIRKYNNDTKYINIYRKDSTSSNSNSQFSNIGLIFPKNVLDEGSEVYTFSDSNVKNGHSYIYYARIFDGSTYYNTYESREIKIPDTANCYSDTDTFAYDMISFSYNESDYSLTVTSTVTEPETLYTNDNKYNPVLIISSKTKIESFELPSLTDTSVINLREILPKEFLDTKIKIEGICGQKIETTDTLITKRVYWTESSDILITGTGIKNNTLTIPSSTSTGGYDYSRKVTFSL